MLLLLFLLLDPDLVQRGQLLESHRDWPAAALIYQDALRQESLAHPDRFWLLTSLAQVAFEQQQYPQSRSWLKQGGRFATSPQDHVRLAAAHAALDLVEGQLVRAERRLIEALNLLPSAPDQAAILQNLASIEMQTGRLDAAQRHLERALELSDSPKAWISLSTLEGLRGQWRAAERCVRKALALQESPDALWNLAAILDRLGDGQAAKRIRSRLPTDNHPQPPQVVDARATALSQRVLAR